jgi:hypothetical protein
MGKEIEVWLQIPDYENQEVSNMGNVRHFIGGKYKYRHPFTDALGYKRIGLSKNGLKKNCLLHRVVMLSFVENPENYKQVNHIDGNKENNNILNLEWCNHSQNQLHAFSIGLKDHKNDKHPQSRIIFDTYTGIFYNCIKFAAHSINYNYGTLKRELSTFSSKRFIYAD